MNVCYCGQLCAQTLNTSLYFIHIVIADNYMDCTMHNKEVNRVLEKIITT